MSVSCAQPEVSSIRVMIGRRCVVTNVSPTAGVSFMNEARLASIDIHSVRSSALNAHASTTWVPEVLMTLIRWPALTRAAFPERAGIVTRSAISGAPSRTSRGCARGPSASSTPEIADDRDDSRLLSTFSDHLASLHRLPKLRTGAERDEETTDQ